MNMIKEWVSSLFILMLIISFVEILIPEDPMSKYVKFFFSMMIMASVIYPIVSILKAY